MSPDSSGLAESESDEEGGRIAVQLGKTSQSRRRFIVGSAATWATTSLAGCGGGGDGGSTATETQTATATATRTETETATPTAQPPENYVVTDDMAAGSEGIPKGASFVSACSPTRKFVPGMHAIWYVGVYDPDTGEQLTNEDLGDNAVIIEFTNRDWDPVELQWAGDDEEHPAEEWNGAKVIPESAETGEVKYTVKVKVEDENANFRHVGIAANSFQIIEYDEVQYVVSNYTYAISSPESSGGFVAACAPEWQYMPGMTVAFAANIYNANTGKEPGPDVIDKVTVEWPNGEFDPIELAWQGDAEEHAEKIWEATMDLPEDVETGTYKYKIVLTVEEANILDAGIATDQITVVNPSSSTTTTQSG